MDNTPVKGTEEGKLPLSNVSRRDALKGGMQAIVAGIVGLNSLGNAQDQTVAVATTSNNFPGRNLETAEKSGFEKEISGLQAEIIVLQEEFQKGRISSQGIQEMLAKLLLNEKALMTETQTTLDVIWEKLEKTYRGLPDGSDRKALIKKLGDSLLILRTHLAEEFNLIKAIRLINIMAEDKTYQYETASLNRPYFKGIAEYIDKINSNTITEIEAYEKSFNAQPTGRIIAFKESLREFGGGNDSIGILAETSETKRENLVGPFWERKKLNWKDSTTAGEGDFKVVPEGDDLKVEFSKLKPGTNFDVTYTTPVSKREFKKDAELVFEFDEEGKVPGLVRIKIRLPDGKEIKGTKVVGTNKYEVRTAVEGLSAGNISATITIYASQGYDVGPTYIKVSNPRLYIHPKP